MNFTYIIAYRHSDERYKNLETILKWISQTNCEIIIVEHDTTSKLDDLQSKIGFKKFLISNNLPFNKSWSFNVGFKNATNDKIVFGDADLIMNQESLLKYIDMLDEYDVVNPYSSVVDLTKEETINYLKSNDIDSIYKIERPGRGETDHQKVPMCGGIILFKRESIEKIGGWNEDFWGWGAEDDFMSNKSKMFLKFFEAKDKCYHLYHEKAPVYHDLYMRNLQIYTELSRCSINQMEAYIKVVSPIIGNIDKKLN